MYKGHRREHDYNAREKEVVAEIEPIVALSGYALHKLKIFRHADKYNVCVYIDRDGGVDLDDCATLSRELSDFFEQKDLFSGAYVLEVSSPGAFRELHNSFELEKNIGKRVKIKKTTDDPATTGDKTFVGWVESINPEDVCIISEAKNERICFEHSSLKTVNLFPKI